MHNLNTFLYVFLQDYARIFTCMVLTKNNFGFISMIYFLILSL